MRCLIVAVAAALCALAAGAAAAQAYVLRGERWPGRTITYFNATSYAGEVRAAVRTWNASGVRVRFASARRSRARVLIVHRGAPGCRGEAQIGYGRGRRAIVELGRGCPYASSMTSVATHELGHILGLDHEDRGCATMNSGAHDRCGEIPAFQYRCRLLERDDVLGAIRRYGGRVAPQRPDPFCPVFAPPLAPTGLVLAYDGFWIGATMTLAEPARLVDDPGPATSPALVAYRHPGACPPDPGAGAPYSSSQTSYGPVQSYVDFSPLPGLWCYAVAVEDYSGRRGPFATALVAVPEPAPPA